jgi:hypothetical protein
VFVIRMSIILDDHGLAIPLAAKGAPVIAWMKVSITYRAKMGLHPLRLANILAWDWLAYRLAPFYNDWLQRSWAKPFILCGRNSLPVFCVGVFLAPLGGMWLATWPGLTSQTAYNVLGVALMVSIAALAAARRSDHRHREPRVAAAHMIDRETPICPGKQLCDTR